MNFSFVFLLGENIDIGSKLIPSWVSFVVQFSALVILLLIVFFVAYKPIKNILKKRSDFIQKNIEESKKNNDIAKQNAEESKSLILDGKKKASEIIESAKIEAESIKSTSIAATEKEIDKMYENANEEIEKSKQDALKDIQNEMVDIALLASSQILKREVNEEDNRLLAEDFIKNIKK